jgi:hypothetical protein
MYPNNFPGNNRSIGCGSTALLVVVGGIVFIVLVLLAGGSFERMPMAIAEAETVGVANHNQEALNEMTLGAQVALAIVQLEAQQAAIMEDIRMAKANTDLAIANAFRDSHRMNTAKDLLVYGSIVTLFFTVLVVIVGGTYAKVRKSTLAIQLSEAVAATAAAAPATAEPQQPQRQRQQQQRPTPQREADRTVFTPLNLVRKSGSGRQSEPEPARPSPNGSNGFHGRTAIYEEHDNEWVVTYVNH